MIIELKLLQRHKRPVKCGIMGTYNSHINYSMYYHILISIPYSRHFLYQWGIYIV